MKIALRTLVIGIAGLVGAASTAPAETMDTHKMIAPQEINWGPAPAALPPGAQAATLYGDPTKEALFAVRLKFPKGYQIAPHTHPKAEVVTVITGTFRLGLGETADRSKVNVLPAGSFTALPPGTAHFAFFDEDTVLQINTTGPWGLNYINPNDDPRQKSQ
jgi:quercetin dioxygenase-like cupin family protein